MIERYTNPEMGIIWSEQAHELRITNAVAGAIVGLPEVANNSLGLDGSGEKISFTDTGIDQDHPDIVGRIAGVYTQFGLDPSPADSNGGHGTHVALTIAGDGSGDSSATGIGLKIEDREILNKYPYIKR